MSPSEKAVPNGKETTGKLPLSQPEASVETAREYVFLTYFFNRFISRLSYSSALRRRSPLPSDRLPAQEERALQHYIRQ